MGNYNVQLSKGFIPNPVIVRKLLGKYRLLFRIAALLVCANASAQVPLDTIPPSEAARDTTLQAQPDSTIVDMRGIKLSNESFDDVVEYGSRDSMWFDVKNKQLHLYGEASVKYTSLSIKAGYILLDYAKNEISAEPIADSTGNKVGLPDFQDGEQNFTASRLR